MSAKKVTIEKRDLPPMSPDGKFLLRYRIISEDKNRNSHWSPIYTLDLRRVQKAIDDTDPDITFAAADISTTSNLINKEHNFLLGQMVTFSAGGGTAPNTNFGPLVEGASYYVEPVSNLRFSLHVSQASALGEIGLGGEIDFLSAGTGTAFTLTSNTKNLIKPVTSSIEVTDTDVIVSWGDANERSSYDIFVSFGTLSGGTVTYEPYSYGGSSPIHSYSFRKKTGSYTHVQIVIQLAGIEKIRSTILTIAESSKLLQPTISGGSA
jgi:hypothetical protein